MCAKAVVQSENQFSDEHGGGGGSRVALSTATKYPLD